MRAVLLTSLSAVLFSGCLTTQENPNYEFSSRYQGDAATTNQYATAAPVEAPSAEVVAVTYETSPVSPAYIQQPIVQASVSPTGVAPTDSAYGSRDVSGTPGYMAMQADRQATAQANLAPALPSAQMVSTAQIAAAGTPIAYDHSRNFIAADVAVADSQLADTVRLLPTSGHAYTVQPGDTVYSLSRKTCVGVNVIQSMNGLSADYGINIGQTLTLPTSVC